MDQREHTFLTILERHKGIIYKVANTYCYNKSDLDDLIQEIIIQIWLSIENYNENYKWTTWIYRIALNTSISFYRKNKSRLSNTVNLSPVIDISGAYEEPYEDKNFILLRRFIQELKPIDKALILLYLEGLNNKEIAEVISITPTNVTTKISRIKKHLKLKFDKHDDHGNY